MHGIKYPLVNDTKERIAPLDALTFIGSVLPRMLFTIATAPKTALILLLKADIEDGFWKVFTESQGRWNFAYVLPQTKEHQE